MEASVPEGGTVQRISWDLLLGTTALILHYFQDTEMKMSWVRNFVTVKEFVISKEIIRHIRFEFLLDSGNFSPRNSRDFYLRVIIFLRETHGNLVDFRKFIYSPFLFISFPSFPWIPFVIFRCQWNYRKRSFVVKTLTTDILNFTLKFISYLTDKTLRLHYASQSLHYF